MDERISVMASTDALDTEALKKRLDLSGCGSIVTFVGITRDMDGGEEVLRLEFDAWKDQLEPVLQSLSEQAVTDFGVHSIAIAHRIGEVGPQQNIVAIHVASQHRKEGFAACSWLIDELKAQAPLWKKEVKVAGATWKAGLG